MKVLILSHANANSGAIDRYEEFLQRMGHEIAKLEHPLDDYAKGKTVLWIGGKATKMRRRKALGPVNLVEDFLISTTAVARNPSDIIIGANNFDTFAGVVGRRLFGRRNTKVAYYASDFSEERYSNGVMNKVYYWLETMALKGADIVISNTHRAARKRMSMGLQADHSYVAYNGAYLSDPSFPAKKLSKERFIFVGSLTKEHGLYEFLQCCSNIVKSIDIIGDGPERESVLELCKTLGVRVNYFGQKDHEWTIAHMESFSGIGLAPYSAFGAKYVYYGSSLKIYEYLACGLPVITSDVTEQAQLVDEYGLGVVYKSLSESEISQRLNEFPEAQFNKRAEAFYGRFNQDKQFQEINL